MVYDGLSERETHRFDTASNQRWVSLALNPSY
jgi:hypothetical protein